MAKMWLGFVGAVLMISWWSVPVSAAIQKPTQVQISFTPGPVTNSIDQQINRTIPTGKTAYKLVQTPKYVDSTRSMNGLTPKSVTGWLPQTDEFRGKWTAICGLVLLGVLGLTLGVKVITKGVIKRV